MTPDEEIKMLRLEKRNADLVAENFRQRGIIAKLQQMHEANQRYIGKLQAQARRNVTTEAERVFGK